MNQIKMILEFNNINHPKLSLHACIPRGAAGETRQVNHLNTQTYPVTLLEIRPFRLVRIQRTENK